MRLAVLSLLLASTAPAAEATSDVLRQLLDEIGWFEVVSTRGHVEGGKLAHYQVTLRIGFTLKDTKAPH